jgi:FMN-dependent oxidoreductase (nitrilotriacetate monooxygenase family)
MSASARADRRQMHLAAFLIAGPVAHSHAMWRNPDHPVPFLSAEHYIDAARTFERGLFDLLFFADRLAIADRFDDDKAVGLRYGDQDSTRMDPLPLLGALAATTSRIGLGATRSTTYDQPYHVARAFQTLDHLSKGRVAWNVVTSMNDGEAMNFGIDTHLDHDARYDRADEFVQLTCKLWDSWEADALVLDREAGIYADPDKVNYVNHAGKYFSSRGPLNIPPGPQGRPVIIQAGASDRGRSFAARWAEVIFNISPDVADMVRFTQAVREDLDVIGRPANACKILAAVMPFVGRSEAEAREKRDRVNALVHPLAGLSTLSAHANTDLGRLDLDSPVDRVEGTGTQSLIRLAERIAKEEKLTLRDIGQRNGQGVLVPQICGTGRQIAEQLAELFHDGGVDGFVFSPALLPESADEFVDEVVPELQRLGLYRNAYTAETLRGHLHDD